MDGDIERDIDEAEDNFSIEDFNGNGGTNDVRMRAVNNLLLRPSSDSGTGLARLDFESCPELVTFLREQCKILVVGAGGLGCELLKNLALLGFGQLHVIDMDTIDLSNLNRQFLFRQKDIGQSKAECAARFINERIPHCSVKAYCNRIEDFAEDFYREFSIVVCGLDSVIARRWMNGMLVLEVFAQKFSKRTVRLQSITKRSEDPKKLSMLNYDENGTVDPSTIKVLVDGGTEGFKGNVRVVTPGMSACLECTIDLYPPAVNFPMCTIAHTPRLPEHCVEYAKVLLWPKEEPFGPGVAVDGDDSAHITWILEKAEERAKEFGIQGLTYRLTLGVVKHVIPAVASTNAIIASLCATEVLKIASGMYTPMDNFLSFNNGEGIYSNVFQMERNTPQTVYVKWSDQLRTLLDYLKESPKYQMRNPSVTAVVGGRSRTLYMSSVPSLEKQTHENLSKSLESLGLGEGQEIIVVDVTSPTGRRLILKSLAETST